MGITAKQSEKQFELVPAGNHLARCYQMIEIGTEEIEYNGDKKLVHRVRIVWELPNEKKVFNPEKGEQPFSIGKDYTLSMHEKATLRHDLQSWRGKAFTDEEANSFDITKLLGKPCMLNVIHEQSKNGNNYAKIAGVTAVPKGMPVPNQVNESFMLSFEDWDDKKFSALPDWLKQRIEKTPQFKKRFEPVAVPQWEEPASNDDGSDLPF
jgi:hypothetical protein